MKQLAGTFVPETGYVAPELLSFILELRPHDELTQEEREKDLEERTARAKLLEKADVYAFGVTAFYVSQQCSAFLIPKRKNIFPLVDADRQKYVLGPGLSQRNVIRLGNSSTGNYL
jgi:hypothetical protein